MIGKLDASGRYAWSRLDAVSCTEVRVYASAKGVHGGHVGIIAHDPETCDWGEATMSVEGAKALRASLDEAIAHAESKEISK